MKLIFTFILSFLILTCSSQESNGSLEKEISKIQEKANKLDDQLNLDDTLVFNWNEISVSVIFGDDVYYFIGRTVVNDTNYMFEMKYYLIGESERYFIAKYPSMKYPERIKRQSVIVKDEKVIHDQVLTPILGGVPQPIGPEADDFFGFPVFVEYEELIELITYTEQKKTGYNKG